VVDDKDGANNEFVDIDDMIKRFISLKNENKKLMMRVFYYFTNINRNNK
jgi:hypothetical protein